SLRLHVTHRAEPGDSVRDYLEMEVASGLANIDYYRQFGQRAGVLRDELRALLYDLKAKGRSIAAYGAAAKGATLLNFAGIDNTVIDFVVDRNIHKVGLFMPGVEIPIREPEALRAELPDHVLILTWNFAGEIVRQQEWYIRAGGKFVLPIPRPMVLDDVAEVQGADYAVA
ncbi:MAG: methyltransferase C-terminal domain-containing protein, partial [Armatimonadota bacterium]